MQRLTRPPRKAAAFFIIATVTIDAIGFGLIMPVLPRLLMELGQTDTAGAALWGGLASFVFAIAQFVFSPVIGGLSDRFGRRPVLLLSLTALSIDFMLMGLAHALWVFFIARLLSGIFAATHSTANAYIADITPPEHRATRFGWLGAAFGVGFILGPALGGLLGEFDPRVPFYAAAALAGLNALYGFFVVPESLATEDRRPFNWRRANFWTTLSRLRAIEGLGRYSLVYFLTTLSGFVYPAVWTYVAIAKFEWGELEIGLSFAVYGLCFVISQAIVIPLFLKRIGERRAVWIGLGVEGVSLIGVATAPNSFILYLWIMTAIVSGIQGPALQKLMTERVSKDAQGELQGGLSALSGLVLIISPLLYTQLFFAFERGVYGLVYPGAPFIAAALFNLVALYVLLAFRRPRETT
jgi:MFS transporter, DHA1 family, tetracycline resistance protein